MPCNSNESLSDLPVSFQNSQNRRIKFIPYEPYTLSDYRMGLISTSDVEIFNDISSGVKLFSFDPLKKFDKDRIFYK